jgi:hypothetical protein
MNVEGIAIPVTLYNMNVATDMYVATDKNFAKP